MNLQDQMLFWKQFRRNFFHMGTWIPSSGALGRASAAYLAKKRGPAHVLEAGAGTGSLTREIIPLLQPGDRLDVVEINPTLIAFLQHRLQQEKLMDAAQVDIRLINADLLKFPFDNSYDFIIFSLPLSNFPPDMVQTVLNQMMIHLKPKGVFSYVKYVFFDRLKYLHHRPQTRSDMKEKQTIIRQFAHKYQIQRKVVWTNPPPIWVYYWQKPESMEQVSENS